MTNNFQVQQYIDTINKLVEQNNNLIYQLGVATKTNATYFEILEKTNSQLSMWTNPYGLMIGILSVFVGLLAVAVAVYIFLAQRNNDEIISKKLKEVSEEVKINAKKEFDEEVRKITNEMNESTGQKKADLQKEIDNISKNRKDLETKIQLNALSASEYMKIDDFLCSNCKNELHKPFPYSRYISSIGRGLSINGFGSIYGFQEKCVRCGNMI